MKHFSVLLLLFGLLFNGVAQDSTKVRFYVKGSSDFWIKLDGELLPVRNVQMITPGLHDIEIWSPMHKKYKGTIEVPVKDSISYYQELKKDPEYIQYLIQTDEYKRKVFIGKTAPLFLAFSGAVASPFLHSMRKRWHEESIKENFKSQYFSSNVTGAENVTRRYNTVNAAFFTSLGLTGSGLIAYYFTRKWVEKLDKPVYRQQNPFTVEMFELGMNPVTNTPVVGLTLNF